ncbi:MAG: aldo/keto reductase [Gammaproteobacteria bacterium]|jgi:aryl-alcohol dehydrogenase-like predicted oxidoreductase|nr:aldo/keto reductase [Gammaproteobacteria bacterium]
MKMTEIGPSNNKLVVPRMGFGCMSLVPDSYKPRVGEEVVEPCAVLEEAYRLGMTLWDTADMYAYGRNEELIGQMWGRIPRDKIILATKCGILRDEFDPKVRGVNNSADYIVDACHRSLGRLKTPYIDILYLHRRDPKVPISEPMRGFKQLVSMNKIRHIGLCEVDAATLREAHAIHPISVVQVEYSLLTRQPETELLPTCEELGVHVVAYSPISRGLLSGTMDKPGKFAEGDSRLNLPRFTEEHMATNISIAQRIKGMADRKNCSLPQLCLAYLLHKSDKIIPIPGTKSIAHLRDNVRAIDVELSPLEIAELESLAPIGSASGSRYDNGAMDKFKFNW